jgi:hypothetical protein
MFAEDTSSYFADFGIAATLAGLPVTGILDMQAAEDGLGTVAQQQEFLLQPGAGVTPAGGQVLVAQGISYTVRQVLKEPPDGVLQRLVIARV